jgi:SAM-dependent methyltransferase
VTTQTAIAENILTRVKEQYERFPYPGYPLWAAPRWQEGYLVSSTTAAVLAANHQNQVLCRSTDSKRKIAILGCGDVLPYLATKWENGRTLLDAVDLSQKNLTRARIRNALSPQGCHFIAGDLLHYLSALRDNSLNHCDAYGVLHHLATPSAALSLIATKLTPGGTARMMVYNADARAWIHHLQQAFRQLDLKPTRAADLATARQLITTLARISPALKTCLRGMSGILAHDARFVDCFFHARVVGHSIAEWYQLLQNSGLVVSALFDRYAELDSLANPMASPPTATDLQLRAATGEFANNFEIHVYKPGNTQVSPLSWRQQFLHVKRPPHLWYSYNETQRVPLVMQYTIWWAWIRTLTACRWQSLDKYSSRLPLASWQRLARLGAVFPMQFSDVEFRKELVDPMTFAPVRTGDSEAIPPRPIRIEKAREVEITQVVTSIRPDLDSRHLALIIMRIEKALRACHLISSHE